MASRAFARTFGLRLAAVAACLHGGLPAHAQTSPDAGRGKAVPSFVDERRLDDIEKAHQAAEAEARRKAEEEKRAAAEAAARRKAEDEKRAAAEAEANKKQQPVTARVVPPAVSGAAPPPGSTPCAPARTGVRAVAGGRAEITIAAPCRQGQKIAISYGSFTFVRQLDQAGQLTFLLDLFLGVAAPVALVYSDQTREPIKVEMPEAGQLAKVAVVWRRPVDLDLHAYEYTARHAERGHVWQQAPSTLEEARKASQNGRGRGFLSTVDDGQNEGDHAEVYTFWQQPGHGGTVSMALDYATRGDNPTGALCGSGPHASVEFEAVILAAKGGIERERGAISAVPCGVPLAQQARYLLDAIPDLEIKP